MVISKPTIGATGWGDEIHDLIDEHNTLMAGSSSAASMRVFSVASARAGGAAQTITATVDTDIDFTTVQYNDDPGLFVVSLAANTITVTEACTILYQWEVSFPAGETSDKERYVYLNRNGSELKSDDIYTNGKYLRSSLTSVAKLTAGSVLGLFVWSETNTTIASSGSTETGLTIVRLG